MLHPFFSHLLTSHHLCHIAFSKAMNAAEIIKDLFLIQEYLFKHANSSFVRLCEITELAGESRLVLRLHETFTLGISSITGWTLLSRQRSQ